jgi:uncharacterized protein with FMN-binding domain
MGAKQRSLLNGALMGYFPAYFHKGVVILAHMKKVIIGVFVVVVFIIYSLHQRGDGSAAVVGSKTTTQTTPTTTSPSTAPTTTSAYKDGQYTGTAADAYYGYIQVQATVQGGKLTDVQFLQYPNDRRNSVEINSQAMPQLKQEAIQAQSAHVNTITGATDTSQAFVESLSAALTAAKV